jgi:uncharacterized protein YbaR (Trm112 family)
VPLDPTLLSIIACPQDHGSLLLVGEETFYNPRLRRAYPIENGIPVLLIDEARDVAEAEHQELLARAGATDSAAN